MELIKGAADVRYQSDAVATVATERILFPVDVSIRKPTTARAKKSEGAMEGNWRENL